MLQLIRRVFVVSLMIAAIFAVLFWVAYKWVWPYITNPFIDFAMLKQETLVNEVTLEALVVRSETVVRTPSGGVLHPRITGGSRVSKSTVVAVVESPGTSYPVPTPVTGVVFWDIDGLEEVLKPGSVLTLDTVPRFSPVGFSAGDQTAKGEPVFRVVDNLTPIHLQFNVPRGVLPREFLAENQRWCLGFGDGQYRGRVVLVYPDDGLTKVELLLNQYPQDLLRDRQVSCRVVTCEALGFVVPRTAVALRSGRPGVYTLSKDRLVWNPVRVEGQLGTDVQVSGKGLVEGEPYVVNAWLAQDGRRI